MEAAVTKPEAASAGIGMMSESGIQTQEVMAGVFFFPGLFQLLSVHLLLGLKYYVIAPVNKSQLLNIYPDKEHPTVKPGEKEHFKKCS